MNSMFVEWRYRLEQAAKVLPDVYGEPSGNARTKASVKRAKELLRGGASAEWSIRKAARENKVAVRDMANAVLAMRGAEVEEVAS